MKSDDELVSLTFGVIYDNALDKIKIKYKAQELTKATIIDTDKGRIWYCFAKAPINYEPEVTRVYKDGTERSGWFEN